MELSIKQNKYLQKVNKEMPIILALSGGVDSIVLLDLLLKEDFKVIIAHVNHNKRSESMDEEKFIRDFGAKHNVKVYVYNYFYEENNFQAEAHDKRYEFFLNVAKENNTNVICTAHHAYDNLETILMNLMKGSNLYGYAGISECLVLDDINIVRPLLSYAKEDIYEYAKENNLKWFEDSSNATDQYLRNRIRHHLIPLMKNENPNLVNSISNYSNQLFLAFHYMRDNTIKFLGDDLAFEASSFAKLPLVLQKDVINYIFEQYDIPSSFNKIDDIIELIENNKPNLSYDLGNNYQFIKAYDSCYVRMPISSLKVCKEISKYDTVVIEDYGSFYFRKNLDNKLTDYLPISHDEKYPLTIRTRRHGDKLIIGNGHKKLKDFLIDKKVPKEERDNLLIVTNSEDEIIWVLGYYKKKCEEKDALNLIFEGEKHDA